MLALALLFVAGLLLVPYLAARALWVIPVPSAVRIGVALAVPGALLWWLNTSPDFHDITSPGAALLPSAVIAGWILGTLAQVRRRLLDRAAAQGVHEPALFTFDLDRKRDEVGR